MPKLWEFTGTGKCAGAKAYARAPTAEAATAGLLRNCEFYTWGNLREISVEEWSTILKGA